MPEAVLQVSGAKGREQTATSQHPSKASASTFVPPSSAGWPTLATQAHQPTSQRGVVQLVGGSAKRARCQPSWTHTC